MSYYTENDLGVWSFELNISHYDHNNSYVQNIIAEKITVVPNALLIWDYLSSYNPYTCTLSTYIEIKNVGEKRLIFEIQLIPKSTENQLLYTITPKIKVIL